jgi:hypothetical protein
MATIQRLKFHKQRKPPPVLPKGGLRRSGDAREAELFTGTVKGFKASKGEERAANALYANTKVANFFFRMTIGAEGRNLPGWKELDYLIESTTGMYYAVEVDSQFSHRLKGTSDILHDAIILENLNHLNIYPQVVHWDIDRDLPNAAVAKQTVKNLVG